MEGQKSILPSMHPHKFCLCALKGLVSQHCYMCDLLSNMQQVNKKYKEWWPDIYYI